MIAMQSKRSSTNKSHLLKKGVAVFIPPAHQNKISGFGKIYAC
jgi:hypothetical protein